MFWQGLSLGLVLGGVAGGFGVAGSILAFLVYAKVID